MRKNCVNYVNEKVCALISLIINLISGILLIVWKKDSFKTATTNTIDKLIHAIIDIFVLLKGGICNKKEVKEEVSEIPLINEGMNLLKTVVEREMIIENLNKFVVDNKGIKDTKIQNEVATAEGLLRNIKREEQNIINKINVN